MKKITFYTNPYSRGGCVRWMLEECGAEYEIVPIQFGKEMKSKKYLSINSMGKVPSLQVEGTVITETAAIITYLADIFPEKNLIPSVNSSERGEFYRWIFFAIHLEYAFMDKHFDIPSNKKRKHSVGYGDYDTILNTFSEFLKGRKYALGNSFTVLDLYLTELLINMSGSLSKEELFASYIKEHTKREAYIKARKLDNKLAKEMVLE